jgi:excisionase family DNA binding protein
MATTDRPYYTVADAARLLQVSPSTVWRWIAAGRLPAQRLGPKTIRILPEDLDALRQPARPAPTRVSLTLEEFEAISDVPPSPEELARRQAVIARIIEHRKDFVITPLTTADLIHQAREEEYESYGRGR